MYCLAILKDKRQGELKTDLLQHHVNYLKELSSMGHLVMCGPYVNNDGAMMIFNCESLDHVRKLLANDPFIAEKYYQAYEINEFLPANDENNWLMDIPQTKGNLVE
ncbi:YciI family protein [Bacillus sp. REN3]|uniref:YciI family protein n=1 Tax=Bacillus sp. REN3 TaxID=2802440 RepID=UPI001AEF230B|nr:YciI family protein [Bacillus sp. REN3]